MEKQPIMDKQPIMVKHPKNYMKAVIVAGIVIVAIVLFKCNIGYNSATQLLVKQSPFGMLSCIDHAGFYFKGFASIYSYDRTKDFYFNSSTEKVKGEGWEGGDDDEDDISFIDKYDL